MVVGTTSVSDQGDGKSVDAEYSKYVRALIGLMSKGECTGPNRGVVGGPSSLP